MNSDEEERVEYITCDENVHCGCAFDVS
jgi:hypothetical protein